MSQIDVLLGGYASEAAAFADPGLAAFAGADANGNPAWNRSRVFAGVQIWNVAQDVAGSQSVATPNGVTITVSTVTHQYQPGFALLVSYDDPAIAPGTLNPNAASLAPWKANANCLLIADRDAANAGNAGFIYYSAAAIAATLAQWRISPTPAGVIYPFGNP